MRGRLKPRMILTVCLCARRLQTGRVCLHTAHQLEVPELYRVHHWFRSLSHWHESLHCRQYRRGGAVVRRVVLPIFLLYHRRSGVSCPVALRVSISYEAQIICH
jgi:hypothetical protein